MLEAFDQKVDQAAYPRGQVQLLRVHRIDVRSGRRLVFQHQSQSAAKWVGALDTEKMNRALNGEPEPEKVEAPAADKPPLSPSPTAGMLPALSRVSQG